MSKFWLLLLLVAAFQAVHSYPAAESDYLEDPETTWGILKEAWGKMKEHYLNLGKATVAKLKELNENYKTWGKEKLQIFVAKLKDKLCTQQDFEEDVDYTESDEEKDPALTAKILLKLKEYLEKLKSAAGKEKEKVIQKIKELRAQICDKLSDYEEEEEEEEFELEEDYEEDPQQSTWAILKETFGKLKDRWSQLTKAQLQKIIQKLKNRYCAEQSDFDEDVAESDEEQGGRQIIQKYLQKLKEFYEKIKAAVGAKKEELKKRLEETRQKFCAKLNAAAQQNDLEEDEGDEERGWLGKLGKGLKKVGKKFVKKLSSAMKAGVKKGMKMLKDNAIKVNPLECEGKFCKSCISMLTKTLCIKGTAEKVNKVAYILINPTIDGENKGEIKLKIGDVPRCMNFGGLLGKICMKGLEGKAKSSSGQANVKFCLAMLAEKYNVGCKFCAIYANKKFKPLAPKLFAGAQDDNGEILQASDNGEDGIVLDADEVEID